MITYFYMQQSVPPSSSHQCGTRGEPVPKPFCVLRLAPDNRVKNVYVFGADENQRERLFSAGELSEWKKRGVDVEFHKDLYFPENDTVDMVCRKMLLLKKSSVFEEMYMFYQTRVRLDVDEMFEAMLHISQKDAESARTPSDAIGVGYHVFKAFLLNVAFVSLHAKHPLVQKYRASRARRRGNRIRFSKGREEGGERIVLDAKRFLSICLRIFVGRRTEKKGVAPRKRGEHVSPSSSSSSLFRLHQAHFRFRFRFRSGLRLRKRARGVCDRGTDASVRRGGRNERRREHGRRAPRLDAQTKGARGQLHGTGQRRAAAAR